MRITGGSLSGRVLKTPKTSAIRPMRDAVRMAMFNMLVDFVPECRFLDLFAGTGGVGIEALSRGASHATFVDQLPEALNILKNNLQSLQLEEVGQIISGNVFDVLNRLDGSFDLIFVGPPYYHDLAHQTLQALSKTFLLKEDGVIIAEVFHKESMSDDYGHLTQIQKRLYGDNLLVFYQWQDSD